MKRLLPSILRVSFLALALVSLSRSAGARDMGVEHYRRSLQRILTALDGGNLDEAKRSAAEIEGARVIDHGEAFKADASILQPIRKAALVSDARVLIPRIKSLLNVLPDDGTPVKSNDAKAAGENDPDVSLLNELRRDEKRVLPPMDGEINDAGIVESGIWAKIRSYLIKGIRWVSDEAEAFLKWLDSLFPSSAGKSGTGAAPLIRNIVIALMALIAFLNIRAYFRKRRLRGDTPVFHGVAMPGLSKDADPLSRDASEWEEYALRLASAGRHREAIRAWYHAVLTTLFRSGILIFRKGRTNWEYYFSFPADFAFRSEFQELTGSFEVEWYGKSASDPGDAGRYGESARKFLSRARSRRNA